MDIKEGDIENIWRRERKKGNAQPLWWIKLNGKSKRYPRMQTVYIKWAPKKPKKHKNMIHCNGDVEKCTDDDPAKKGRCQKDKWRKFPKRRFDQTHYSMPARPSNARGPESFRGVNGLSSDVGVSDRKCGWRPGGTLSGCDGCQPGMFAVALRARSSLLEFNTGEAMLKASSVSWLSSSRCRFSTSLAKIASSGRSASCSCSSSVLFVSTIEGASVSGSPDSFDVLSSVSFSRVSSASLESSTSALRSVNARQFGHWNIG